MRDGIQLMAAWIGSLGFGALFNIRGKKLFYASFGGFLAWGVYLAVFHFYPDPYLGGFVASVALTIYAECMARYHKTPVTVFLVSAAIPLIPGAALYRSMNCLMKRDWEGVGTESAYTLLFAASMSAGITVTTVIFRMVWNGIYRKKRL